MQDKESEKTTNKSITRKDFDIFRQEVLSEFRKSASKDDLKSFATKDDLEKFLTKEDARMFATKGDLDRTEQRLSDEIREKFDVVISGMDQAMKKFESSIEESRVGLGQYKRQKDQLADHENRIKVLETSRP